MYSGETALMKSKYPKQDSQEGPLTPLIYSMMYTTPIFNIVIVRKEYIDKFIVTQSCIQHRHELGVYHRVSFHSFFCILKTSI